MEIREIKLNDINDELAEMVALFRVELRSYKGIASTPNLEAGKEEMEEYLFVFQHIKSKMSQMNTMKNIFHS